MFDSSSIRVAETFYPFTLDLLPSSRCIAAIPTRSLRVRCNRTTARRAALLEMLNAIRGMFFTVIMRCFCIRFYIRSIFVDIFISTMLHGLVVFCTRMQWSRVKQTDASDFCSHFAITTCKTHAISINKFGLRMIASTTCLSNPDLEHMVGRYITVPRRIWNSSRDFSREREGEREQDREKTYAKQPVVIWEQSKCLASQNAR